MSEGKAFLEKVHIKNYLSLRDVRMPLKHLTVLVGPNASGKSNVLSALNLLNAMTSAENPPPTKLIQDCLWAGEVNNITFELQAKVESTVAAYKLELSDNSDNPFVAEELLLKGETNVQAISIANGEGKVKDEDGLNKTNYKSNKLALKSAGDYGNKPITRSLTEFIKGWEFYNFDIGYIRGSLTESLHEKQEIREAAKLDSYGRNLGDVLWNWHKNSPESFEDINESLASITNLEIDQYLIDDQNQFCLLEGYKNPIPLRSASDGTLRLVAYNILLNEPELPPLIAIEEPEQNLHPGALTHIANVLEQIAERSQVIITTHSSQLLGAFNQESLGDSLGVLLLNNRRGFGTEVLDLEDYRGKKKAFDGWIADFGIGSAVFDLGISSDEMEDTAECQA
ncbi:MAG: AAA family ATPase [Candidatus Poribacteria bacterium]|nr:AAA family ATPase [Candidatus Poribacteria bacterium]